MLTQNDENLLRDALAQLDASNVAAADPQVGARVAGLRGTGNSDQADELQRRFDTGKILREATADLRTAALTNNDPLKRAARDKIKERSELLNNWISERREFCYASAQALIDNNHSGSAADLMMNFARSYEDDVTTVEDAANAYIWIADRLRERNQYGWAGSRYYDAAMAYVGVGDTKKCLNVLQTALSKLTGKDSYFQQSLQRHTGILGSDLRESAKVATLEIDFKKDNQYHWIERCEKGIRVLASHGK
jgi:hypothetical protein